MIKNSGNVLLKSTLSSSESRRFSYSAHIRNELVALLYPLGSSFEALGVDADHLFRRVNMQKVA